MGTVYQARDRQTEELVAIKVLRGCDAQDTARFQREAVVLAQQREQGIIRYAGAQFGEERAPDLVEEWRTRERLTTRLRRAQLPNAESWASGAASPTQSPRSTQREGATATPSP